MEGTPSFFTLPDGGTLAYRVLGHAHLKSRYPLVLVGGMNSVMQDWARICYHLAENRPVLMYDHRGMGHSKFAHEVDDISIKSIASDLNALLSELHWSDVDICGTSMGGVVVQQLLFLPYDSGTPLTFNVKHIILAATTPCVLDLPSNGFKLPTDPTVINKMKPEVLEHINRIFLEMNFDPDWVQDEDNRERLDCWAQRHPDHRPFATILKQAAALRSFDFQTYHAQLPDSLPILIIHGELDAVLPFAASQDLLQRLPSARMISIGSSPGDLPHMRFGHVWWEYFNPATWTCVFDRFLDSKSTSSLHGSEKLLAKL